MFGFADTQFAFSTAFLYGNIPFMKSMERMINPFVQDTEFDSVTKVKHIDIGSDSDSDRHDVNNLVNQNNPVQQNDPIDPFFS